MSSAALAAAASLAFAACGDDGGSTGCIHRFEVTDTSATEVVISGDVMATGYLGVCGSGVEPSDEQEDAVVWIEVLPRLSCLPMEPDAWVASDGLAGVMDHVRLATDGATLVALGDSYRRPRPWWRSHPMG